MTTPAKIDLFQLHKAEYAAARKPALVTVNPASYLAIAGQGAPGGPEFTAKVGALYAMAYTIKMTRKFAGQQDYVVGKLEGLWWLADPRRPQVALPREQWRWTLLIRTPDFIQTDELCQAAAAILKKGKTPEAGEVKLEILAEGLCVQMLHVGPYERIAESVALMQTFAEGKGLVLHGVHHEIYLSDPRRVPTERLKTIVREPVTKR
jgi:hypothetical protein